MINLKIDPEFQSQIPPLTDDEFKQLEENILKEGKLLSPLIVWNNILVDGHNRYAILQKHPEIYFSTMPLPFESREEVLAWICKNQLGRRNLTPEQKYYLMGKQYEAEKAAHGGDRKSTDAKSSSLKANLIDSSKTCDRIAEENRVSKDTVIRASRYMRGVEIAEELIPGLKQSILSGQTKVSKADMHRLAKAAYNDRAQTLQDILHPETHAPLDICEQHTMCLMLCCLVFNICECGFQRSKIVLMLVNDLQNHITLCIIGHLLQLVVE